MSDELDRIKLQAQVDTLQYMLQRAWATFYIASKQDDDQIRNGHDQLKQVFLRQTFSTDASHSALVSGELEDAMSDFLAGLEEITRVLRK